MLCCSALGSGVTQPGLGRAPGLVGAQSGAGSVCGGLWGQLSSGRVSCLSSAFPILPKWGQNPANRARSLGALVEGHTAEGADAVAALS